MFDRHSPRPRVLLVGLGATSRAAMEGLTPHVDLVALMRPGDDPVVDRARRLGVDVIDDSSVQGLRSAIDERQPDAVVVSSFNRIIGPDLIDVCPFINVHYAPLPRGRGRATVNWAIINGDDAAWITIHHLVPELDAGGILFQGSVPISMSSTVSSLYDDLNDLQQDHIAGAVLDAIDGAPGRPQVERSATYYCTRVPDDGEIDWTRSSVEIARLVRALQPPFPSAFTWLGLEQLHIDGASLVADGRRYEGRIAGRIVHVDRAAGSVDVLTGDGSLRLTRVRLGDGPQVAAAEVVRSVTMTLGLRVADLVRELRADRS